MYKVKVTKPKRAKFNLSHEVKLTADFGSLIPFLCQEVIPGDKFRVSTEVFCRFNALIAPVMQRVQGRIEYFFVPNRIIYEDWQDFITGDVDKVMPYFDMSSPAQYGSNLDKHSLADYLGVPIRIKDLSDDAQEGATIIGKCPNDRLNALPFRAYQRIWNDWYRDQNLETNPWGSKPDDFAKNGGNVTSQAGQLMQLRYRCWPHDYFTTALPWAQKGDAVRLPLTTMTNQYGQIRSDKTVNVNGVGVSTSGQLNSTTTTGNTSTNWRITNLDKMIVGPTIEEVRRANAVQRWLEKNARFGSRYVEQILAHFGVHVPDYRLDRSEFLGRGRVNVVVSEVLQQSETTQNGALGDQGGHAVAGGLCGFKPYYVQEHGFIIGLLSFVPNTGYGAGLDRKFTRQDYLDFAFPEFDRLGEQPLYDYELDAYGNIASTAGLNVFGYKPRYDEYKHSYSRFCGDFRDTLSYWHLGRLFGGHGVSLNGSFVKIMPYEQDGYASLDRIFATQDVDDKHILVQLYNHVYAKRPLSRSIPSL